MLEKAFFSSILVAIESIIKNGFLLFKKKDVVKATRPGFNCLSKGNRPVEKQMEIR